jgi:hypothetical protein
MFSSYLNGSLTNKRFKRWLSIMYLNTVRILILCGINWVWLRQLGENGDERDLEFFNLFYYGFMGYLGYLGTYPKVYF